MTDPRVEDVLLLRKKIDQVLQRYPNADPDNVRHALILLNEDPWERLNRSLLRGQKQHFYC